MRTRKHDTRWLVSVALMAAIIIVLANTPLGMIQLPIIKATTVHIPVIIGAILLGPSAGAMLGAVFGLCSLISNTTVSYTHLDVYKRQDRKVYTSFTGLSEIGGKQEEGVVHIGGRIFKTD